MIKSILTSQSFPLFKIQGGYCWEKLDTYQSQGLKD